MTALLVLLLAFVAAEAAATQSLTEMEPLPADELLAQFPPLLDSVRWSSGLPRLLLSAKDRKVGLVAGAQLRLFRTDVSGLKAALQAMPDVDWDEPAQRASNAWIDGRTGNLQQFKPGARAIMLIFSDQDGSGVYRFPWYDRFRHWVEPWLLQILGADDVGKVMRLQLAVMAPHTEIKPHLDTGGYAAVGHRIHVVVQSNPDVVFLVCESREGAMARNLSFVPGQQDCPRLHVEEGLVFELNNRLMHTVSNRGERPRIHLIIDAAETARPWQQLRAGGVCRYDNGKILCPAHALVNGSGEAEARDELRRRL